MLGNACDCGKPSNGEPTDPTTLKFCECGRTEFEWVLTTSKLAESLSDRAVVGGYEADTGGPLWVIRARKQDNLIPGKFSLKTKQAYIPFDGKEVAVDNIEVFCCSHPTEVNWIVFNYAHIPPSDAVVGGDTSSKEKLYIGRAEINGSLVPGMVQPSQKGFYMTYGGVVIFRRVFEYMCLS